MYKMNKLKMFLGNLLCFITGFIFISDCYAALLSVLLRLYKGVKYGCKRVANTAIYCGVILMFFIMFTVDSYGDL